MSAIVTPFTALRRNIACCVLFVCFVSTAGAVSDRDMLEIFYNTCNGENWDVNTHWLNASVNFCDWEGIGCTDSGDKVEMLQLQGNNVICSLPLELFLLSELVFLDLRENHAIEANFSLLDAASAANLQYLILSDTNVGSLQGIDVFADSLTTLYVSGCSLRGTFPEGVLQLTALNNLDMSYNAISGVIPDGVDSLTDLRTLGLSHNFFSGQIPSTIGNLTRLSNFQLQFNALSGTLPPALGDLFCLTFLSANDQIQRVGDSQVGGITGPLIDFADLQFLFHINLSNNLLNGSVPSTILASTIPGFDEFTLLDLRSNRLTGLLPESLGRFQSIEIYAADNQINSVPAALCQESDWLFGQVGQFGCNAILCPPGTYNSFGRQVSEGFPCLACSGSVPYYGGARCDVSPFSAIQLLNETSHLERLSKNFYFPLSEPSPTTKKYDGHWWRDGLTQESDYDALLQHDISSSGRRPAVAVCTLAALSLSATFY